MVRSQNIRGTALIIATIIIFTSFSLPQVHAVTYEDYTTYTEYDGSGTSITIGSTTEYTMKIQRTYYFWLLTDKGAGQIPGTMHYRVEFKNNYANLYSTGYVWGVSNTTGTSTIDLPKTDNFIGLAITNNDPGKGIRLVTEHDAVESTDVWYSAVANIWYYCDIIKEGSTVTVNIYTSSDYSTTLVDTLTVTTTHTGPWRYLWASSSTYQGGIARLQTANVAKLSFIPDEGRQLINYTWLLILSPAIFGGLWMVTRRKN